MSRILSYAAGVLTGVLFGIIGTGALITYNELEMPGLCAKFSEYMDAVTH